LVELRYEKGK